METEELRELVTLASGGRGLWPNRLGFDWRGWSYAPDNATGLVWYASRERDEKHGSGSTPEAAKANALAPRRVREAVSERYQDAIDELDRADLYARLERDGVRPEDVLQTGVTL